MDKTEQVSKLTEIMKKLHQTEGDWVKFTSIGSHLSGNGINYKELGFPKLNPYLKTFSDLLEFEEEIIGDKPPVYYARLKISDSTTISSTEQQDKIRAKSKSYKYRNNSIIPEKPIFTFSHFANGFKTELERLSNLALKERWNFNNKKHKYTILEKYLIYTFERLQYENKVMCNDEYASFNTGLVDRRYSSIYMMFKKRLVKNSLQKWVFWDFAIAGEDWPGKELVRQFNPLPERARYFEQLSDLLYENNTLPECDYTHILQERVDRLPYEFIKDNCPDSFIPLRIEELTDEEKEKYIEDLSNLIKNNTKMLQSMTYRLRDSVNLALKRVEWNYKTAIPMYYPKLKKPSLLLPICLMDDDKVDVALVTEKTSSGAYLGHTILTLEMAYNNARLITRPDSDWLLTDSEDSDIITNMK